MSEGTRIGLRLLGLALFLIGVAGVVLVVVPGPSEIADWMGESCAHTKQGPSEQCTVWDVLDILWVAPTLLLVGGVMMLALRPESAGPMTIDLSRRG